MDGADDGCGGGGVVTIVVVVVSCCCCCEMAEDVGDGTVIVVAVDVGEPPIDDGDDSPPLFKIFFKSSSMTVSSISL